MLPGVAPPGRGPPGRGGIPPGPGRGPPGPPGPTGLGIAGRSTGCAEENGLLPTRGGRGRPGLGAAGPGRGPGAAGRTAAVSAAGAAGATGGAGGAGGAAGAGAAGLATGGAGGAVAIPPPAAGAVAFGGAAFSGAAALAPPNDSRSRRATGASTVDDADLTNSPCSLRRARTSLLVTPSSFANSCTRALPGAATTSPTQEATAVGGPRLGFSYDAWSSGLHGVLMFFATCSLARGGERCEVLDHRGGVRCTGDAQRSAEGVPPDRRRQTADVGMQPGTPARVGACGIHRDGRVTVLRRYRHHPEQFDSQLSLPAADAHAHRSGACVSDRGFALDHGSVYRHQGPVQNQPPRSLPAGGLRRAGGRAGRFGVAADVDPPAGQAGRQPGVLPLLADGQRQLEVRHDDPRGAGGGVHDGD